MTREEAIKVLNMVESYGLADLAKRMAIKALEQECDGSTQKRVGNTLEMRCDDAISRQAVLKLFATNDGKYLYEAIRDLPPVKPQYTDGEIKKMQDLEQVEIQKAYELGKAKTGHWIKTISENGITSAVRCSECGFEDNRYMLFNYCPNCGAKMESEEQK